MNCNNNQNNNNGCGCNYNPHPTPAPEPVDINMNVCDRNINMLPMLQTYTTKVLKPNICCKKNILKQCMINCENYKYVIQYDFTLGEDITVPANCILEFDGGSIKGNGVGSNKITCNNTTIKADPIYIFDDVILDGTLTEDLVLNNFKHSSNCVISQQNTYKAIHVIGICTIDEPMFVDSNFSIYGDDMYMTRIVLSSEYNGDVKTIFLFNPENKAINRLVFKDFGVSNVDYVFYRKQTDRSTGSTQVADFKNLLFNNIKKGVYHFECYGLGCINIVNNYFWGDTNNDSNDDTPLIYFLGYWFNNNIISRCRCNGKSSGFLKIRTENRGEINQNTIEKCWFESITLKPGINYLFDIETDYNLQVINIEKNYFERIYKSDGETLASLFNLNSVQSNVLRVNLSNNLFIGNFENLIHSTKSIGAITIAGNGPSTTAQEVTVDAGSLNVVSYSNTNSITYNASILHINKVEEIESLNEFSIKHNHALYISNIIQANQYIDVNLIPSELSNKIVWWSDIQVVYGNGAMVTGKIVYYDHNYIFKTLSDDEAGLTITRLDFEGNYRISNTTESVLEIRICGRYSTF